MLSKLQRLAKLSLLDWAILMQMVAVAVLLEIALRLFSLPSLVRRLSSGAHSRLGGIFPLFHRWAEYHKLSEFASLAARIARGPESCLPRSLLLFWLLQVRREPVVLVIGVRKDAEALLSHAWIETPGGMLGEVHHQSHTFLSVLRVSSENPLSRMGEG